MSNHVDKHVMSFCAENNNAPQSSIKNVAFSEEIHVKKYMTLHGESGTCLVHCAIFLHRKMCLAFEGKDFPILKLVLRRTTFAFNGPIMCHYML